MTGRVPKLRALLGAAVALAVGAAASLIWLPPDASFGFLGRMGVNGDMETLSSGRSMLWRDALSTFAASPWLGQGEGSTYWLVELYGVRHLQPHNAIIQFLQSWGVIAAVPALYLGARLWFASHRQALRVPALIPIVIMIDSLLAMSMFDGILFASRTIIFVAAGFAVVMATMRSAPPSRTSSKGASKQPLPKLA